MNARNEPTTSGAGDRAAFDKALRDNLSPEAIAMIAAYLQPTAFHRPTNEDAKRGLREVEWFTNTLTELLGVEEQNRLMEELGL